ncbi:hypothetical protein A1Q2_08430 [Trichosporon asahii var. asahii CBS 8904]|uniref:Uncharacterized protein n=2 Tax=Trichosporon asahii var. asahii TaxID=189963 RepID=K1VKG3_TRIAC|nr:hypothetical protein A1Q1_01164 [Trichosporon asahii var. asahii CBS 2479]EJT49666.1 hypothetical protein A1Q1_01164 [Trichosporon asahii var. asahii CBS 2479]EKC97272.1 hypothetical protein A1Q2_08430 [Trichosporon asahii var. asahii CBS 8904]
MSKELHGIQRKFGIDLLFNVVKQCAEVGCSQQLGSVWFLLQEHLQPHHLDRKVRPNPVQVSNNSLLQCLRLVYDAVDPGNPKDNDELLGRVALSFQDSSAFKVASLKHTARASILEVEKNEPLSVVSCDSGLAIGAWEPAIHLSRSDALNALAWPGVHPQSLEAREILEERDWGPYVWMSMYVPNQVHCLCSASGEGGIKPLVVAGDARLRWELLNLGVLVREKVLESVVFGQLGPRCENPSLVGRGSAEMVVESLLSSVAPGTAHLAGDMQAMVRQELPDEIDDVRKALKVNLRHDGGRS